MYILGFGFGIIYVGCLFLLYFIIEFRDVIARGAEVGSQVFQMALELAEGILHVGVFLLVFGAIFVLLGLGYRTAASKNVNEK